jgi:hypothetical protein
MWKRTQLAFSHFNYINAAGNIPEPEIPETVMGNSSPRIQNLSTRNLEIPATKAGGQSSKFTPYWPIYYKKK